LFAFEIVNLGSLEGVPEAFYLLSPEKLFPNPPSILKEKPLGSTQEISFASSATHAAVSRRVSVSESEIIMLSSFLVSVVDVGVFSSFEIALV
jgi:hypothetical protein